MKEPIDAAVRAEALDHRRSFIVQAPAGSGKTELLTRRILNLLAKVEKPEEVLAITFTRKAASEMRQRVIEVLENAAADVPVTDAHEQQGRRLAETVLQRSQELGWDLLDNPGRLQLQTIDSFCAVLTRQLPVTSAFGGVLSVAEDASPLYLQAAERCIARGLQAGEVGAEALEVLLSHLDTNLDRLQTLMKDMLSNRDQWLRHYHRVLDSRKEMEDALFALIDDRFSAFAAVVPQDLNEACLPLLQHASSCTAGLGTRNQFNSLDGLKAFPAPSRDNALFWRDIANLLLTNDGGFRKRIDRNAGFPTNDKDAKVLGLDALYLREKSDSVKSLIGSLSDDENFRLRLQEIRTLPAGGYSDQQWQVMESLIELMLLCVAELHLVFSDEATVDYAEISIRASNALGALDEPTDLALAMDYRLRHILVDEFQDTSISQFALFEKLLDGWEPDDGRTFFAVGDPMQSIYLFRDAEVGLFLQASADGIGPDQLEPLQLECNFRSDPVLVDWSNKVFSSIFPAEETIATGAISYASSTPFRDSATGSGQFTHTILSNDRKREAECVVELVEAALASDDPPDSLAILVRSKMNLAMVFPKLQAKGIDYQAIDIETLGDRLVVKDILSMLRALQHPLDRISWLSLLRAPFCGLTLTDLHTLVADNSDEPIWSLLTSEAWKKELSEDGKARLERLMGVMAKAVNRAVKDGLVSWLEASWLALGGPASCQTEADLLAADACFTELGRIEEIGRLWDPVFVNGQMKRLFAPAGSATAVVQMMTIHKSKGLEFDTVILPGLARPARADQSQLLNWFECRSDDGESRLLMAPVTEKGAEQGSSEPILDFVKSFRAEKSGNELLRLLYVAATRARRNLHLVTHAVEDGDSLKLPVKSSLAYPLWLELTRGFQSTEASDSQEILDEPEPPAMIRIKSGWTVPDLSGDWPEDFSPVDTELLEAETLEFEWAGQVARLTGSLVHRQIQRIVDEGLDQWSVERVQSCREFYRTHLTAQGVASESLENAIQTVVTAMTNLVTDEKARWLLNPAHRNSVSEYRITGLVQGSLVNGIIDRMFVDESGQRWIVDFKTGSHLGADAAGFLDREQLRYKPQLERYAAVVSSLESEPVRLGLYFTLLKGWREWQPNLDK